MNNTPLGSEAAGIEAMEHIKNKICMMWATAELEVFLNKLLMDSRGGKRQGFPVDVMAELLFLAELNKMVRAIDLARKLQIPLRDAYEKIDLEDRGGRDNDIFDPLAGMGGAPKKERDLGARPARQQEQQANGNGSTNAIIQAIIFLALLFVIYTLFLK